MSNKLGVLILHGIGKNQPDFASPMIDKINKYIKKNGCTPEQVTYQQCCWDAVMQSREDKLWEKINIYNDLKWTSARKFCVNTLVDAVAYREDYGKHGGVYDNVHNYIYESLKLLKNKMEPYADKKPIVVIARSFGGYIISDYIWDRQHNYNEAKYSVNDFLNMRTLVGIITYGCNIPFFTMAYDDIQAIKLPPPHSRMYLYYNLMKWYNFYDKDDILGMPLKGLSESYNKVVSKDIQINVGSIFSSWNPFSHGNYGDNDNFLKPVAQYMCDILKVVN